MDEIHDNKKHISNRKKFLNNGLNITEKRLQIALAKIMQEINEGNLKQIK